MIRNRILAGVIRLAIAAVLVTTALIAYLPQPAYCIEYTFLSNLVEGLVLLIFGIALLAGRPAVPALIDLCLVIMALIMLGIVLLDVSAYSFSGPTFFLHIINPLLVLANWLLVATRGQIKKPGQVMAVLVFPVGYLAFLFSHGAVTGDYIYPIFDVTALGLASVALFIGAVLVVTVVVACGLWFIYRRQRVRGAGSVRGTENMTPPGWGGANLV